jgi:hypothetical protein
MRQVRYRGVDRDWPGWTSTRGAGREKQARRWAPVEDVHAGERVALSWGAAADHSVWGREGEQYRRSGGWGPGVRYYVDLEVFMPKWPTDTVSDTAGHIERGFATKRQMRAWVAWLRSCVEVAGLDGLRALNARTGGRLA